MCSTSCPSPPSQLPRESAWHERDVTRKNEIWSPKRPWVIFIVADFGGLWPQPFTPVTVCPLFLFFSRKLRHLKFKIRMCCYCGCLWGVNYLYESTKPLVAWYQVCVRSCHRSPTDIDISLLRNCRIGQRKLSEQSRKRALEHQLAERKEEIWGMQTEWLCFFGWGCFFPLLASSHLQFFCSGQCAWCCISCVPRYLSTWSTGMYFKYRDD